VPVRRPTTFGELLRQHRQAAGLTQQALAELAGLSVHGIQKLERGATTPYRDTARRLSAALQLNSDAQSRFQEAVSPVRRHGSAALVSTPSNGAPHNLPVPVTSLVGREAAMRQIEHLLATTRLLTLTGIGGCGKTRLALEVGRMLLDHYPDGVWLVELGPLADPALVTARVATAVGVREMAEQPLSTTLSSVLRQRHILLVLDNCEHLLDACAQLIDGLLRTCPDVRVLATSREPVGISGEVAWRVPSFELPSAEPSATLEQLAKNAAVQLFVQRATAARPQFSLTQRNAPAVVQVCRRLDGIPLALELAAARIEALTAEQIAQRLDHRFRLLMGGSRTALPRQQTLGAALDWSYDLLDKHERLLFERVAVFTGGWTLEAAEAVCSGRGLHNDDILDVLAKLTRKSLVVADETSNGAERYSLLETVRDYARQKLALRGSALIAVLRERHAGFYTTMIEQLLPDTLAGRWSADTPGWSVDTARHVDFEYDNIRSVLSWWIESRRPLPAVRLVRRLGAYWNVHGLYAEGRRWLLDLLELYEQTDRTDTGGSPIADRVEGSAVGDRAFVLDGIGMLAAHRGDYDEALARLAESAAIWRARGDRLMLAQSLGWRSMGARLSGNPAQALEQLEESRRLVEQCEPDSRTISCAAMIQRNLGMITRDLGEYKRAAEHFRECIRLARVTSEDRLGYSLARGLCHLGRTEFLRGDIQQAKLQFRDGLSVMRSEGLAGHTLADCLDWVAALAGAEHRTHEAAVLFGAAEAQWQASGAARYWPERATYAAELADVQATLAKDEFASAWSEGHAFSRERAIAYALVEVGDPTTVHVVESSERESRDAKAEPAAIGS
jgi:non-specific serine/threonine protein kinase